MVSEQEISEQLDPERAREPEVTVLAKNMHGGYRADGTPYREPIDFDMEELEKLCVMQCTLAEIAAWFNCSESVIDKRRAKDIEFKQAMDKGYAKGRISIRRKQIQLLEAGGAAAGTMAVWLGKNVLGQRDYTDLALHSPGSKALEVNATAREVLSSRIARLTERLESGGGDSSAG